MTVERLLTLAEVAEIYQVKPRTVKGWIDAGQLEGLRMPAGRGFRVKESALERILHPPEPPENDSNPF